MFIQNIISLVTIHHSAGSEAALESSRYLFIKPVKYESVTGIKKKLIAAQIFKSFYVETFSIEEVILMLMMSI